ncbi:Uncharacterised protein [Myroides odoratus]|uniref:Uncharacterized protein n=1 Tax=Myroides odoratus TaxID=256 RepID=A0A378RPJ0_MYROD|nr:Uncharacterised protein [Myroides odoratus]
MPFLKPKRSKTKGFICFPTTFILLFSSDTTYCFLLYSDRSTDITILSW